MRRTIAIAVLCSLSYPSIGYAGGPLLASALKAARQLQLGRTVGRPEQQVLALGVGAPVKVKLATGEKIVGSIVAIETGTFDVVSGRDNARRRVAFGDVADVTFTRTKYVASGTPDPEEIRRVVIGLVGRHVAVKVAGRSTYRGHVEQANDDHVVLMLDQADTPLKILYADVERIGPNLSGEAKVGLWASAIVLGLTLVLVGMELAEEPDI